MKNKKILFKSIISLFLLLILLILYKELSIDELQTFFEWLLKNKNDADSYVIYFTVSTIASMFLFR